MRATLVAYLGHCVHAEQTRRWSASEMRDRRRGGTEREARDARRMENNPKTAKQPTRPRLRDKRNTPRETRGMSPGPRQPSPVICETRVPPHFYLYFDIPHSGSDATPRRAAHSHPRLSPDSSVPVEILRAALRCAAEER